jgi:hypothetical protein
MPSLRRFSPSKALSLLPADAHAVRSSLHINLAGLLDQMDFVHDALVILHAFLDASDITSYEAENNFAVGYMMVAQLELRAKRIGTAEAALAASLQLQPRLRPAVMGVQQELWQRKDQNDLGSDILGGVGISPLPSPSPSDATRGDQSWLDERDLSAAVSADKDPWLLLRLTGLLLRLIDIGELWLRQLLVETLGLLPARKYASFSSSTGTTACFNFGQSVITHTLRLARRAPRVTVLIRKLGNAFPCIASGVVSRAIAEYGWQAHAVLELSGHVRKRNFRGSLGLFFKAAIEGLGWRALQRSRSDSPSFSVSYNSNSGGNTGVHVGELEEGCAGSNTWHRIWYWLCGSIAVLRFLAITFFAPASVALAALSSWLGWQRTQVGLSKESKEGSLPRASNNHCSRGNARIDLYLVIPLLLGHGYSMWTEYMTIDCLVLLFVGGLIFPFVVPPPGKDLSVGPLRFRLICATENLLRT